MTLRDAWTTRVTPEDYEAHMARNGQAQANAAIVRDLLSGAALPPGSKILLAGAGTGQIFDYLPAEFFAPYRLICSDIHAAFLARLRQRVPCETVIDDVEDSRVEPGLAAIILVLVLEHVDWRRALASLRRLQPERFLIVIQRNPAVNQALPPAGTMRVFAEEARPNQVPFSELAEEMAGMGFHAERLEEIPVADGKTMAGGLFVGGGVTA